METITVSLIIGQVMIVVIGTTSSWKSILTSGVSGEESVRVELTTHQWNTAGINVLCCTVSGMAVPSHVG